MKEYISFKLVKKKTKTNLNLYQIISNRSKEELGYILWYIPWRQYCFFPNTGTIWNKDCLNQIINFVEGLK